MADNNNIGSNYFPGLSTDGILYNDEVGIPRFSSRFNWNASPHLPQVADHPINICSSSNGLIACHDTVSNIYHIGNPAIDNSYIPLPETPRQHNAYNSDAVLVANLAVRRFYHLICFVQDSMTVYNCDVYCSLFGRWFSYTSMDLQCNIIPDTGVSTSLYACWLAEKPRRSVIIFDNKCPNRMISRIVLDREILDLPGTLLQLGRVGNKLGLATVEPSLNPRVVMYLLEQGNLWHFQPHVSFNLPVSNLSVPKLIRFQSFKAALFFWVDGQVFLWEEKPVDPGGCLRIVNMGEAQVGYAHAHVITPDLPGNFNMTIQNIGREDHHDC